MIANLSNERVYNVWWRYQRLAGHRRGPLTKCFIGFDGTQEYIAYGSTRCAPSDRFEKEKGRKLSLAEALREGGWDRSERRVFWQAYFARANKPLTSSAAGDKLGIAHTKGAN